MIGGKGKLSVSSTSAKASFSRAGTGKTMTKSTDSSTIVTTSKLKSLERAQAAPTLQPPGTSQDGGKEVRRHRLRLKAASRAIKSFQRVARPLPKGKAKTAIKKTARPLVKRTVAADQAKARTPAARQSQVIRETYANRRLAKASQTLRKDHERSR